jgi:hypothetical protein
MPTTLKIHSISIWNPTIPSTWQAKKDTCGNCIAWFAHHPWVLHLINKTNAIHFSRLTWLHHHYKYCAQIIIIIFNNYWFCNCLHWVQMEICLYQQWIHNLNIIFCHNLNDKWITHKILYNFHIFEMKIKHDCQHVMCFGYNVRLKKGQERPQCIENLAHHSQLEFL